MDYQFLFDQHQANHSGARQSRQRRLYHCLRDAILRGQLKPGTVLPGSRSLAAELKVARNTVLYAYEQLMTEGLLVARERSTLVAEGVTGGLSTTNEALPRPRSTKPWQLAKRAQLRPWPSDPLGEFTAFVSGVPALADFLSPDGGVVWSECGER